MAKRAQFKIAGVGLSMDNMKAALRNSQKKPTPGVTQGGSSKKFRGAKVAATDGAFRRGGSLKHKS